MNVYYLWSSPQKPTQNQHILLNHPEWIDTKLPDQMDIGKVLNAMEKDSKIDLDSLAVDGGACANNFLMQFQSDILKTKVIRPKTIESTALGAAYLAGIQTGYFQLEKLKENHRIEAVFKPNIDEMVRKEKINLWNKAIKSLIHMHNK